MLKNLSRGRVIAAWFVATALTFIVSFTFGAAATPGTWALLMLISLMPPAIFLAVSRNVPPPTLAKLLNTGRPQDAR